MGRFRLRRQRLTLFLKKLETSGSVAVEYALILPLLLTFIYGILEISHYGYIRLFTANIAHDAARYAIVHSSISADPLTSTAIQTYVNNELTAIGLTATTATVTVTFTPSNAPGSSVNVRISYPFVPFMPGFNSIPGTNQTFSTLTGPILAQSQLTFSN